MSPISKKLDTWHIIIILTVLLSLCFAFIYRIMIFYLEEPQQNNIISEDEEI